MVKGTNTLCRKTWFECGSKEGLVFLIYRNETKRALLPNEVTSVDTIRALFVRAFPDALSMQYLESKRRKIYIMDQATNVYYELEDMKDVKDRTVLKVYETDVQGVPPSPSRSPKVRGSRSSAMYNSGHESDSSTRSAPAGVPRSPLHHHRQYNDMPNKVHSLPVQPTYVYHQQMQQYASQYGAMGHQGMGSPTHYRGGQNNSNNNSPSRVPPMHNNLPPNQRHSLAFIPDTNSAGAPYPPVTVGIPQSRSYNDYYDVDPSRSGSATPTGSEYESRQRIDKMEAQLANLTALVQTQAGMRPGAAISNSSLVSDTASAKSRSESDSQQATPVQTPTSTIVPGLSDLSSATPTPGPEISVEFQNKLRTLHSKAKEMKLEVRTLRRVQIDHMNIMKDTINITFRQIKDLLAHTPCAIDLPVRFQRSHVNNEMQTYTDHTSRVDRDLKDLEIAVEELRSDVLNKRCRVNPSEIETMALALSNVSKALADLKGRFPTLQENLKSVMAGEMEVVVKEEKFLLEEPDRVDAALKRCKKLTGTLFTLKRLSSVQEKRPIVQPHLATNQQPAQEDKRAILENIQSIVPNHDARLQGVEAAEAARERKKRLVHNGEVLRFEKSLEMAQKQLRETNSGPVIRTNIKHEADPTTKANIPLTETTKRLSQQERTNGENGGAMEPDSPTRSRQGYDINTAGLPHAPVPVGVSQTPAPPGISASYIPTPHVGGNTSPSKLNQPATSTPVNGQKAQAHVTFSDSVIEITDNPIGAEGGESGKKVPPPPPPRKSSRTTFKNLSPTHGQPKRPFSPPAYENIENLNINTSTVSDGSNSSASKQQTSYNRSVSAPASGTAPQVAISQLGAQYHAPKQKPMSKFQQELAAGIYANMNRPDLQGQKLNPAAVVSSPNNIKEDSQARDFSDNESTTSNQDSQAGLARKMLAAKLDQESPSNLKQQSPQRSDESMSSTNGVKMREGKKVPPPPPVRRTSQLSSKPDNRQSDNNDSITVEEKRRSVSELQKEIMQQMERQGNNPSAAPSGDRNNTTPERNGVLPNQQHKHLTNGDIIRTDASFAVNTRAISSTVTTITNQHKVTNIHVQKQSGKKNETDIY